MNPFLNKVLLLTILLLLPFFVQANQNEDVIQWSEQTLLNTLTASYVQKNKNFAEVKKNYSFDAWSGMVNFLGNTLQTIKAKKMVLHPTINGTSQVLNAKITSGIPFWRVQVDISVPELNVTLGFILLVLASNSSNNYPYIIQSLNIKVTPM